MLSALAISISFARPAAADRAELLEGRWVDGVRLSGLEDSRAEARWLALLESRPKTPLRIEAVQADIRRLWETKQFARVDVELASGDLIFAVERRHPEPETAAAAAGAPKVSIELSGNRGIGDKALRSHLASHGEPLDRDELWRDELRLRALYRDRGYLDAHVSAPAIRHRADRREVVVRFRVTEGERYRYGAIDGADLEDHYSHGAVLAAAASKAAALGARGHAFASVDPRLSVNRAARTVDVSFVVEPGPVARIAAVIVRGNKRTRDSVIRREIEVAEGDPYDAAAIERSRRRIAALGFFEQVAVKTEPGTSEREAVVTFEVGERKTGTFQIGAGFSTLESFIATAGVEQANLFGTGQSLGLDARLSAVRQQFRARWVNPRVADTHWKLGADLYNARRVWNGFVREALGASATVGRQLNDRLSASLTYRLERVSASQGESIWAAARGELDPIGPDLYHQGWVSSLRATVAHDSRDDRLRPTRGTDAGVFGEIASPLIGSEVELGRVGAWLRTHRPVGPVGVHGGAEVGLVSTRDPAGVPLAHRYQLGGLGSVRGYESGALGPRLKLGSDPDGALRELGLGGNLMAKATLELTAPLIDSLGLSGVVFTDVGNVFNLDRRYCDAVGCPRSLSSIYRGLRASVGFGLRWWSPIGPLRFEWGIPLFRRPGDPWIRFHFGVGLGL